MPKEYKFTLGQEIIGLCWNCLDKYFEINNLRNDFKLSKIKKLSLCFDKLKCRLRMAEEVEVINRDHFTHLHENYLFSIGEQIGGWQKWADELEEENVAIA